MSEIRYINRLDGQIYTEKVYGQKAISLLYGNTAISSLVRALFLKPLTKWPFFSWFYGIWQKQPFTRKKIIPFINTFHVDSSEFLEPVESFTSFNDFFIRKLKTEARPIAQGDDIAVIPADGRYHFYQNIDKTQGFIVKDLKFNLETLLQDSRAALRYKGGSMVIARLCPSDYHRFHFPVNGMPGESNLINGWLYSVNPLAIKKNINIFSENKRCSCLIDSDHFGAMHFLEIGATNVGSIQQTYTPYKNVLKGDEKGFFEFGGSALILLFEPGTIIFDHDLVSASIKGYEIKCLMGQSMGKSILR